MGWRESVYNLQDVLGLPIRRNSLLGRFKKRYVSGMTRQIRIPLEAARIQELAYLCDLHPGPDHAVQVSVGVSKARGRATSPRAHLVRIAAVAPEYPVILRAQGARS